MYPPQGISTPSDLTTHTAVLDAHTLNWREQAYIGTNYNPLPWRSGHDKTLVANILYAKLIFVPRTITFSDIWIDINAGDAGKVARLGIYNADATLTPSTLVRDYGVVSVAVAVVIGITADQQLTKGYYFTVVISDGVPDLRGHFLTASPLGGDIATNFDVEYSGFSGAQAYGALPANFPASTLQQAVPSVLLETKTLD